MEEQERAVRPLREGEPCHIPTERGLQAGVVQFVNNDDTFYVFCASVDEWGSGTYPREVVHMATNLARYISHTAQARLLVVDAATNAWKAKQADSAMAELWAATEHLERTREGELGVRDAFTLLAMQYQAKHPDGETRLGAMPEARWAWFPWVKCMVHDGLLGTPGEGVTEEETAALFAWLDGATLDDAQKVALRAWIDRDAHLQKLAQGDDSTVDSVIVHKLPDGNTVSRHVMFSAADLVNACGWEEVPDARG